MVTGFGSSSIIDHPLVAKIALGIFQVLGGGDHITIKSGSEVVVNILGWVLPFRVGEVELVTNHTFGSLERSKVVVDIIVGSKVWDEVVDVVSELLLLVLVLGATS